MRLISLNNSHRRVRPFLASICCVLSVAITFAPLAQAVVSQQNCGTLDYTSRFVPPKNQGNAGFCYSFTASDLISEAIGLRPPATASAFYTASRYISLNQDEIEAANRSIVFEHPPLPASSQTGTIGGLAGGIGVLPSGFQSNFDFHGSDLSGKPLLAREGGNTDLLIAHLINNKKVCVESEIPSQLMLRRSTDPDQQNFFAVRLGELGGGEDLNKAFPRMRNRKQAAKSVDGICLPPDLITPARNQIRKINSHIQDWAAMKLRQEADKLCQSPVSTDGQQVHFESFRRNLFTTFSPSAPIDQMMKLLEEDRPFGLHYDVCLISKCDANYEAQGKGWHASTVVGRIWNTDTHSCQIKIKNSWGEGCSYAKDPKLCKDGYYFLDVETFAKSDSELIWINKK